MSDPLKPENWVERRVLMDKMAEAHKAADWLLAEFLMENRDAMPSKTSIIDLMAWSLRKQKALRAVGE